MVAPLSNSGGWALGQLCWLSSMQLGFEHVFGQFGLLPERQGIAPQDAEAATTDAGSADLACVALCWRVAGEREARDHALGA